MLHAVCLVLLLTYPHVSHIQAHSTAIGVSQALLQLRNGERRLHAAQKR
jgi:hypothetical protein